MPSPTCCTLIPGPASSFDDGRSISVRPKPVPGHTFSSSSSQLMKAFKNFIAGKWVDAASGGTFENRNPADWNDVIGKFPRSHAEDVEQAVQSAKRGFALWSRTPAPLRGDILRKV